MMLIWLKFSARGIPPTDAPVYASMKKVSRQAKRGWAKRIHFEGNHGDYRKSMFTSSIEEVISSRSHAIVDFGEAALEGTIADRNFLRRLKPFHARRFVMNDRYTAALERL